MPADERSSVVRSRIRVLELVFALLVVAIAAATVFDWPVPLSGRLTGWIALFVPGVLGAAALVGAALDAKIAVFEARGASPPRREARTWRTNRGSGAGGLGKTGALDGIDAGSLALSLVVGGLAAITLWWIGLTGYAIYAAETGGVLFGPVLALLTGSLLGCLILLRTIGGRVFPDGASAWLRERTADT